MSAVDGLRSALQGTRQVLTGIRPEQRSLPTPCPDWSVAELTAHLIGGNRLLAAAVARGAGDPPPSDQHGDGLAAYDRTAAELLAAFGADGALDSTVTVPFGTVPAEMALHLRITELLVHGWDLARATGQRLEVPDSVVEQELAFSRRALQQLPPDRSPFAPAQPAPDDASALDRLAALLGRSVS